MKYLNIKNNVLKLMAVTLVQLSFVVIASASNSEVPESLINLEGGEYGVTIQDTVSKLYVLPSEEKPGAFLMVLLKNSGGDDHYGKILYGEYVPNINAIAVMQRSLSQSKEEFEIKSKPEALIKKIGKTLSIAPQAGSDLFGKGEITYHRSNATVIDNYVGDYSILDEGIFSFKDKDVVLRISADGAVDASLKNMSGQFHLYQEVEGVAIFRGVVINQNMQAAEVSEVGATAVLVQDGTRVKLLLSTDNERNGLQNIIVLKKK